MATDSSQSVALEDEFASNPLFTPSPLDLQIPDFQAFKPEHFEPALREGMRRERAEWEAIATDPAEPTIANTVEALERSGELFDRAERALWNLVSATNSPELDELEERMAGDFAAHSDAYSLDARLYQRFLHLHGLVKSAAQEGRTPVDADGREIDPETARLIQLSVEGFERDGVSLTGAAADRLREINGELSSLSAQISKKIAQAMHEAGVANFTATPELVNLETHAERVELLGRAMSRGLSGEHDTRELILSMVRLRAERAELLGYPHHAAIVAAESAAGTTEAVSKMLGNLVAPAMSNARSDAERLASRMASDPATQPGESFGPADWPRYESQERKERFGVDDAFLAPYLELSNVVEKGAFYAASKLYGLSFVERPDLARHMYDADMRVWEVHEENGDLLGIFVGDFYSREGKQGGAWMTELVPYDALAGTKPVIINCLNITKPESGPTLLTWDNVITVFHEFGHALHGLFAASHWPSLAGTNVPRDVVEFPSQVNEIWALHPEVLAHYATHVESGETIPAEVVEQLLAQGTFGQGYATTEYLGAALVDQAWHTLAVSEVPESADEVEGFEHAALAEAGIDDALVPPRYRTTYFSHAFGGGYSGAYYAYIWSEVMAADTEAWFRTDGEGGRVGDLGLNREAGEAFRRAFLSQGDSRDPLESYRAYRGSEPALEPLLKRRGLA